MVLVSHRHAFIYLKTHKTASTSAEGALEHLCVEDPGAHELRHYRPFQRSKAGIIGARGKGNTAKVTFWVNHMPAWQVAIMLGPRRFRAYRKIAVLRNPYARTVSYYHRILRDSASPPQTPDALIDGFRAWLPRARLKANHSKIAIAGIPCIDTFLFLETLADDLTRLKAALGDASPLSLPTYKSKLRKDGVPYQAYYDPPSKEIVAHRNALEIRLGDYSFDGGPGPNARRGRM